MSYIRMSDIPTAELDAEVKLRLVAHCLTELAVAQAFTIIHGDHAAQVYVARGGLIRFDGDGEPLIPTEAARMEPRVPL